MLKSVIKDTANVDLKEDTELIVSHPIYFGNLTKILDETPLEDIANYLTFGEMVTLSRATTDIMRQLDIQFQSIFTGMTIPPPR